MQMTPKRKLEIKKSAEEAMHFGAHNSVRPWARIVLEFLAHIETLEIAKFKVAEKVAKQGELQFGELLEAVGLAICNKETGEIIRIQECKADFFPSGTCSIHNALRHYEDNGPNNDGYPDDARKAGE